MVPVAMHQWFRVFRSDRTILGFPGVVEMVHRRLKCTEGLHQAALAEEAAQEHLVGSCREGDFQGREWVEEAPRTWEDEDHLTVCTAAVHR
jgi:hypothetical protein